MSTTVVQGSRLETVDDIFYFVADKLINLQKGVRSTKAKQRECAYYGDNGMKCAIGWLIPTYAYNKKYEGWSIMTLLQKQAKDYVDCSEQDELIKLLGKHTNFLIELQSAHDNARNPEEMKENLRKVAKMYNIELPDYLK